MELTGLAKKEEGLCLEHERLNTIQKKEKEAKPREGSEEIS
jgi:hypothetical protein